MSFLSLVADQLNLRWAWEKVRNASTPGDIWIDEIDIALFELNLEENLVALRAQLLKGRYNVSPIRPMAFPKGPKPDGTPQVRQYFHFRVADQVAWVAITNVLAPFVDGRMPPWSYGNRLHRSIWIEPDSEGLKRRRIGRYRHSSGRIYLPFQQSWPIFRRHVYLTIRAMSGPTSVDDLSAEDGEELAFQERLDAEKRCPFVLERYWRAFNTATDSPLYWCSIDLERFFPSMKLSNVLLNIVESLPDTYRVEAESLLRSALRFPLDLAGWSEPDLRALGLRPRQRLFASIPTGLFVAGFLANAGLLRVDSMIAAQLPGSGIAHFRYVDDHIFLSHDFDALVNWIDTYVSTLQEQKTGAGVNHDKSEPQEFSKYLMARSNRRKKTSLDSLRVSAMEATELDPDFPSPLMTKTLTLVSQIGRTDFHLLEEQELDALVNQLEHFLLVDIPETEMPERTRLAFAATRLAQLAEQKLSNDSHILALEEKVRSSQLDGEGTSAISQIEAEIRRLTLAAESDGKRVFTLLRKVLHDKPDRVRLWTRAVQLCRQIGVPGLTEIFRDIHDVGAHNQNALASDYLLANTLALIGSNAIIAARLSVDSDQPEWRRRAARAFLRDVKNTQHSTPPDAKAAWYVLESWRQYNFGLLCAQFVCLHATQDSNDIPSFSTHLVEDISKALSGTEDARRRIGRAWWASRMALPRLRSHPEGWVLSLGLLLPNNDAALQFWRFFPSHAPASALLSMLTKSRLVRRDLQGWWYDAVRYRHAERDVQPVLEHKSFPKQVVRNIRRDLNADADRVSLVEWCDRLDDLMRAEPNDPRLGEWTSLEIVRQIASVVSAPPMFSNEYISLMLGKPVRPQCLHPANILVPRAWLREKPPTWVEWRATIRETPVSIVPHASVIDDARYAPLLTSWNKLTINPVRSLGLTLYGLLTHSFRLPAAWNGPGHSDVLRSLPRLLMHHISCSSFTLGVLQGCLQPRAVENLSIISEMDSYYSHLDDDRAHDPYQFYGASDLARVIPLCQSALEAGQLSTLNRHARQLTPIDVRSLTEPRWNELFRSAQTPNFADLPDG